MADLGVRWDKTINIAIVGGLLFQSCGFGWWASSLNARLDALERGTPTMLAELVRLDAAREQNNIAIQGLTISLDGLRTMLAERTQRFDAIQESLDRLEHGPRSR